MVMAITAMPGQEAAAPGGTLATSGWRGANSALITLGGAGDEHLRAAAARSAALLGVTNHFHWAAPDDYAARLARAIRALRPHVVLAHLAVQAAVLDACVLAGDEAYPTPGLAPLDEEKTRLWVADSDGASAVDVSAARPLQFALRHYYPTSHQIRPPTSPLERFSLLAGPPLAPDALPDDLFAGLHHCPLRAPLSFLHPRRHSSETYNGSPGFVQDA